MLFVMKFLFFITSVDWITAFPLSSVIITVGTKYLRFTFITLLNKNTYVYIYIYTCIYTEPENKCPVSLRWRTHCNEGQLLTLFVAY
jgi:hypothetical protein